MIHEKAAELGRMIGQSDEYKEVKRARASIEESSELKPQLEKLDELAAKLEEHLQDGTEPSEAAKNDYEELFGRIQTDSLYQRLVVAQANFDKMMLHVNEQIMDGAKKGAESSIITLG